METLKNALDFSDFPKLDLTLAATVAIFLMVFPFFAHSSFAMSTLIQFLIGLRIQTAEVFLRNTGLAMDEIAVRTGMTDASTMARTFKKLKQKSPREFRRYFTVPTYV